MKKIFRALTALFLCFSLCLPGFGAEKAPAGESFTLGAAPRLILTDLAPDARAESTVSLAVSEFAAEGLSLTPVRGGAFAARTGDLVVSADAGLPREGYEITVTPEQVFLRYSPGEPSPFYGGDRDHNGLLYGLRRVLKLFLLRDGRTLESGMISEAPLTNERIFLLDCARKYFTPDWICNLIRQISWLGFNGLELHLSDEQGLRADIWGGGELSWLCGSTPASWVFDCPDPDEGKYLTAPELDRIIRTAEEYHVEILPSLESPGHCRHLCKALEAHVRKDPEFSFDFAGETFRNVRSIAAPGDSNVLNLADPAATAFFHRVLEDFAGFFGAYGCTKFNLCADEVPEMFSPEAVTDYVNQSAALLQEKGWEVRVFSDPPADRLDPSIGVVWWHRPEGPFPENRKIYNASQEYSYYVLRKFNTPGYEDNPCWSLDARDPENIWWTFGGGTAENILKNWDPTVLAGTERKPDRAAGAYYLLWCDYPGLTTEKDLWQEYGFQEKLLAHSIRCWTLSPRIDYEVLTEYGKKAGSYPGMEDCAKTPALPEAPEITARWGRDLCTLRRFLSGKEAGILSKKEAAQPGVSYACLSVPG